MFISCFLFAISMCLHHIVHRKIYNGGIYRGGLMPALAPPMPVDAEEVPCDIYLWGKSRGCSAAKGCIIKNRVRTKRKKTLGSDAMDRSKKFCHPAHDDEHQRQAAAQQHTAQQHNTWQVYTTTYGILVYTWYSSLQCNYHQSGPGILLWNHTHTTCLTEMEKNGTPKK